MSFNSVTLTVAGIIFVVLLVTTAYFIYQDQKSKFTLIQSTCPDYWLLKKYNRGPNRGKNYCEPNRRIWEHVAQQLGHYNAHRNILY